MCIIFVHTKEEELHPDHLKEDLDKILNNPQAAPEVLQARASKIDKSSLKSMLTTKEGMTDEKAEQYLNKAEEFLESIRSKANETRESTRRQGEQIADGSDGESAAEQQGKAEQAIQQWFDRMNRPELEYNTFKNAARRIMDDPKTAPSVLKKQLSHMNRESLVTLVSNNKKISHEQAEQYADKIEEARDEVLNKTDQIERAVAEKTQQVKDEA
ncbi:MAG: hypothetical protein WD491_10625 [Balneolales bacterium]